MLEIDGIEQVWPHVEIVKSWIVHLNFYNFLNTIIKIVQS
jgi:hypothetical protein